MHRTNRREAPTTLGRGLLLATLLTAALIAACGGGGDDDADTGGDSTPQANQDPSSQTLNVAVASYDLVANQDNRFIAGILTLENDFVSYGTAQMRFFYLGSGQSEAEPRFLEEDTGSFLQIPGEGVDNPPDTPTVGPASQGRGVYAVEPINFDQAGFWQVDVTVETADNTLTGSAAFQVVDTAQVPAPGDKAIATDSLTVDSDVAASAIDSRATTADDIPDPELHQISITDALQQDKPLVIVFATPVFCVSQFCGPITEMIEGMQPKYADQANFIHVEIWNDYQKNAVNKAAADWLLHDGNLNEPWVFLVDKDGTIVKRWDNVATEDEVQSALDALLSS
jgi:hypothetical protein